ncbi:hypothetical protein ACLIMU_14345, partial [Enterococcus faecium]|uniref:hypothetical protein n=1 Tax=Enterococcus faecium TaxID=1352 RepID=UPI003CF039D7
VSTSTCTASLSTAKRRFNATLGTPGRKAGRFHLASARSQGRAFYLGRDEGDAKTPDREAGRFVARFRC